MNKNDLEVGETQFEYIGNIELGDTAWISDPCYDRDVWCLKELKDMLPGKYACFVARSHLEDFGIRVAAILIVNMNHAHLHPYKVSETIQNIGVDTARCGVFDDSVFPDEEGAHKVSFREECYTRTPGIADAGILGDGKGIVSKSGRGDGAYFAYLSKREDGKIYAICIDFFIIDDEEDEDGEKNLNNFLSDFQQFVRLYFISEILTLPDGWKDKEESWGNIRIEGITLEQIEALAEIGEVDLETEGANNSAGLCDFVPFMRKHPGFTIGGYFVPRFIGDTSVYIDEITYLEGEELSADTISDFANEFHDADEFTVSPSNARAWWD
jgi:hypothetical protein